MDEDTGLVRSSVAYPFEGPSTGTRLVFGAALHFVGVVVFVGATGAAVRLFETPLPMIAGVAVGLVALVPVFGYVAATVRALLDDDPGPPGFDEWGPTLRDGWRVAFVTVLYAAPAVALVAAAFAVGDEGGLDATSIALVALAGAAALVASYVLPSAIVTVVNEGEPSAAWDGSTLREAVVDRRYLAGWLLAVGFALVGGAVGAILAPFVVGFVVLFVANLAAVHAVTRGVIASLDLELGEPPAPPASGYVPGWEDGPRRKELSDGRLGGSLLPTTPGDGDGDGDIDADDPPPASGPLATKGDGGDGSTDLDRRTDGASTGGQASRGTGAEEASSGSTGPGDVDAPSTDGGPGSDITPVDEGDGGHDGREKEQ